MVFSWASSSLIEKPEKRGAATAIINPLSQRDNIWSPYFFRPEDDMRYPLAMLLIMAFSLLNVGCRMLIGVLLIKDNRKILEKCAESEALKKDLFCIPCN